MASALRTSVLRAVPAVSRTTFVATAFSALRVARSAALPSATPSVSLFRAYGNDSNAGGFSPPPQNAPNSNVFIGNLAYNISEHDLRTHCSELGVADPVRLSMPMKMGRPGGYAFIEFSSVEDAQHAIDILSREQIADRQPTVNFGSPRPAGGDRPFRNDRAPSPPSSLLFIGGLRQLGADELNQVIRENSTDTSVRYPVDFETGEPKGFAFVQAASVADATELKERLSEVIWPHGINPRIDYGQPREDKPRSGRGGFGGGRGGGRGNFGMGGF